jgi:hypothetical protein
MDYLGGVAAPVTKGRLTNCLTESPMTAPTRVASNRRNATKSTCPWTP